MRLDLETYQLIEGILMAKQQTTRRQKSISRLLQERKKVRKQKPSRLFKKK